MKYEATKKKMKYFCCFVSWLSSLLIIYFSLCSWYGVYLQDNKDFNGDTTHTQKKSFLNAAFMINFLCLTNAKKQRTKKRAKKKNSVLSFNLSNSRNGKDGKLQKFRRSHCFSNFTLYFTYFSLHLLYNVQKSELLL